jgi:uncharacterized small protein (DUF1192 family)
MTDLERRIAALEQRLDRLEAVIRRLPVFRHWMGER